MNFKDLENCVSGETVLVGKDGRERVFMGIVDGYLITYFKEYHVASKWSENEIQNWSIKKKTKKVKMYQYAFESKDEWFISSKFYVNDNNFLKLHSPINFKRLDYTEIEVEVDFE